MAWQLIGKAVVGAPADVHSSQQNELGMTCEGRNGSDRGEFIYLSGVASLAANDLVVFNEDYTPVRTLAATDSAGPVAVAHAAVDAATEYGWFQIYGPATVNCADTVLADKQLYLTSTAGRVDDADGAGDAVIGLTSQTAGASNTLTAFLNYPHLNAAAAID